MGVRPMVVSIDLIADGGQARAVAEVPMIVRPGGGTAHADDVLVRRAREA